MLLFIAYETQTVMELGCLTYKVIVQKNLGFSYCTFRLRFKNCICVFVDFHILLYGSYSMIYEKRKKQTFFQKKNCRLLT